MRSTVIEHFDQIPPCICRLCARLRGRAKLLKEIAAESGLPLHVVKSISNRSTWAGVKVEHAQRFSAACGVDLLRPRKKLFYLYRILTKRNGFLTLARGLSKQYVLKQIHIAKFGARKDAA